MKKTLRNLMLAGAAALLATGANAQTIEKVWEITSGVPGAAGSGDLRFMTAKDGKVLVNDKANAKIVAFDENGQSDYFDLSEALDTHYGEDKTVVDEATGEESVVRSVPAVGTLISTDDAGNILVNTGFPNAASATDFIIISSDLSETYKLKLEMPEGIEAKRCDQMGRIVGDMLSEEGAYMWVINNGLPQVAIIKVVSGEQDMDYSQASTAYAFNLSTSCVAQPLYSTVAEIDALMDDIADLTPSFWLRNRSNPQYVYQWSEDGTEASPITLSESTEGAQSKNASNEGFEVFTLQGETYFVIPMTTNGTTNGRGTNWGIYRASDQKLVATWEENPKVGVGQGMGGFYAENIDENSVKIYHFIAANIVGAYTFSLPAPYDGPAELYIVGYNNQWDPANPTVIPMSETPGVYKATLKFDNSEFKFSENKGTWDEFNTKAMCIRDDQTVALAQPTGIWKYADTNCKTSVELGKEYEVEIDYENETITIKNLTGIEGVEVEENAEAVYYNLQGVKVANPANGAFIKVQGGKASKVLVK